MLVVDDIPQNVKLLADILAAQGYCVSTASGSAEDFLGKPVSQPEMLARVRSLLRIRALHETVRVQRAELAEWNRALATRVESQVVELGRLARLKRFFSPQMADVIARDDETMLRPHRRMVTVVSRTCVESHPLPGRRSPRR